MYPGRDDLLQRGKTLAIAVGCYKLAKNSGDSVVVDRLRATIEAGTN